MNFIRDLIPLDFIFVRCPGPKVDEFAPLGTKRPVRVIMPFSPLFARWALNFHKPERGFGPFILYFNHSFKDRYGVTGHIDMIVCFRPVDKESAAWKVDIYFSFGKAQEDRRNR